MKSIPRGIIRLGPLPKAIPFLQGLLTQDLGLLQTQACVPNLLLSNKGKVVADLLLHQQEALFVEVSRDHQEEVLKVLKRHRLRQKIEIDDVSQDYFIGVSPDPKEGLDLDPRLSSMGYRGLFRGQAEVDAQYLDRRLVLGVLEGDYPSNTYSPFNLNFDFLNFLCTSKGCYLGQEPTIRTLIRGSVRKRVVLTEASLADLLAGNSQVGLQMVRSRTDIKKSADFLAFVEANPQFRAPPYV